MTRHGLRRGFDEPPRPFIAFAATTRERAIRLYRAQNLIWVWLGLAALLSAIAYFARPDLGLVLVTKSETLDLTRTLLFAVGGVLISGGVWMIKRSLEVLGHILFTSGALLSVVATTALPGNQTLSLVALVGLSLASGFRAYYIVRWIGADVPPGK